MTITIAPERPDSADGLALISELDAVLHPLYAPEDRHGYDVTKLLQPGVHFFIVRSEGAAAGCGGVHIFDASPTDVQFGELKRMFVRPHFRGLGLGRKLVEHMENFMQERGIGVLRLETGIYQTEAIALYEKLGFRRVKPFGDYRETDVSLCYEKLL
ncbi:MAG: GNAT family N-acetyltransferase [Caldilineaceae bacterium]|nr:GNAT family N-acetyltransferase [Caldilineaceae bacterium]